MKIISNDKKLSDKKKALEQIVIDSEMKNNIILIKILQKIYPVNYIIFDKIVDQYHILSNNFIKDTLETHYFILNRENYKLIQIEEPPKDKIYMMENLNIIELFKIDNIGNINMITSFLIDNRIINQYYFSTKKIQYLYKTKPEFKSYIDSLPNAKQLLNTNLFLDLIHNGSEFKTTNNIIYLFMFLNKITLLDEMLDKINIVTEIKFESYLKSLKIENFKEFKNGIFIEITKQFEKNEYNIITFIKRIYTYFPENTTDNSNKIIYILDHLQLITSDSNFTNIYPYILFVKDFLLSRSDYLSINYGYSILTMNDKIKSNRNIDFCKEVIRLNDSNDLIIDIAWFLYLYVNTNFDLNNNLDLTKKIDGNRVIIYIAIIKYYNSNTLFMFNKTTLYEDIKKCYQKNRYTPDLTLLIDNYIMKNIFLLMDQLQENIIVGKSLESEEVYPDISFINLIENGEFLTTFITKGIFDKYINIIKSNKNLDISNPSDMSKISKIYTEYIETINSKSINIISTIRIKNNYINILESIQLYNKNLVSTVTSFYKNINNYFCFLQGYTYEKIVYGPDCGINTILNIITDIYDFTNKKIKGDMTIHPLLNDYLKEYSSKEEMIKLIPHKKRIEFDILVYQINSDCKDCFIINTKLNPDDIIINLRTIYIVFSKLFAYTKDDLSKKDYGIKLKDMFNNIDNSIEINYYNIDDPINIMIDIKIDKNKYNFQKLHSFQDNENIDFERNVLQNFSMYVSDSEIEFNNLSLIFIYSLMYSYFIDLSITEDKYEEPIIVKNFIMNIINNKKILDSKDILKTHPFITNNILLNFLL
jgi:hypothetical protein